MRPVQPRGAAAFAQRGQRGMAAHAGRRDAHRVAVARQIDAAQLVGQVGVHDAQVFDHDTRPVGPWPLEQRGALLDAQRAVGGQHGAAGHRRQALMLRVDVAQARAAVGDVVPRQRRPEAIDQRMLEMQVRHQPRRLPRGGRRDTQGLGHGIDDARRDVQRQRAHQLRGCPALGALRRLAP